VLSCLKKITSLFVIESFTEIGLFLGLFKEKEDSCIINRVLLLGKDYIYMRKCVGSLPSLRGFVTRMGSAYDIELHIARPGRGLNSPSV